MNLTASPVDPASLVAVPGYVVVREPAIEPIRDELVRLLNATRRHDVDAQRFEWMYRGNPDGEAAVWFVRTHAGEIAGFAAALPRRMNVRGQDLMCWNCADLSVLPPFRRQGLAALLRGAARRGVEQGEADFLYGHPNDAAAGAHEKAGNLPVGRMVRYARPLRTAAYLERGLRHRGLSRLAGAVIDPVLRITGRGAFHRPSCRMQVVDRCRFDQRFDELFARHRSATVILGVRDARYLNWRYADNPLYETSAILAEEGDQLRGYLLFTEKNGHMMVKDVFPPSSPAVLDDLICRVVQEGYRRLVGTVSVTALEGNPALPAFEKFGFSQRPDGSRMFAYAPAASRLAEFIAHAPSWYLTVGDRDI